MQSFPQKRKGLAENLATAFCSTSEFLSETKILGVSVGSLIFLAALIAAITAYNNLDSYLYAILIIVVVIPGQVAHFLFCERKGLSNYLLETGSRLASLGVGWWISYTFLDLNSFSGVFPIIIAPFIGEGVYALYRKRFSKV